jgi:hypothetical protein
MLRHDDKSPAGPNVEGGLLREAMDPPGPAAQASPSTPLSLEAVHKLTGLQSKAVGILMGCMVGDVLGAAVEGWTVEQLLHAFPHGLTDLQPTSRGKGCYTGELLGEQLARWAAAQ